MCSAHDPLKTVEKPLVHSAPSGIHTFHCLPRSLQQPHRRRVAQQEWLACSHARPDLAEAVLGTASRAPLPLGIWARGDPACARDLAKRKPRVALRDSRRRCLLLFGGLQLFAFTAAASSFASLSRCSASSPTPCMVTEPCMAVSRLRPPPGTSLSGRVTTSGTISPAAVGSNGASTIASSSCACPSSRFLEYESKYKLGIVRSLRTRVE